VNATIPRWRIAAGLFVLAGLLFFAAMIGPLYVRNFRLQNYVGDITRSAQSPSQTDDVLRGEVLQRAAGLRLPVTAENVHITRSADALRIEVRYAVRVDLPLYTVDLHFYPGAGSR
jgi:hypothetical protein